MAAQPNRAQPQQALQDHIDIPVVGANDDGLEGASAPAEPTDDVERYQIGSWDESSPGPMPASSIAPPSIGKRRFMPRRPCGLDG